jgi:hypothetical protein
MSSFSFGGRIARVLLAAILAVVAFTAAEARDRGAKPVARQAQDFYAYAPAEQEPAAVESHGCFTTNSPVEATRGIRHWSGRC